MKKIKFNYVFDKTYNPHFIIGVHGSINPNNLIVMNFFNERAPLPTSTTYDLTEEGAIKEETALNAPLSEKDTIEIIRFIETGITLDINSATQIRDWLTNQINTLNEE